VSQLISTALKYLTSRGKKSTVSLYLCCIPGTGHPFKIGTFSSFCPAGCALNVDLIFSAISRRLTLVVSPLDKASDTVERSFADSISGCGNTSLKIGSSGTLDLSYETFNCALKFKFTDYRNDVGHQIYKFHENGWVIEETNQSIKLSRT
jgi:hypothetical protein